MLLYDRLLFRSYNDLLYKITDTKTNGTIYTYKEYFNEPCMIKNYRENYEYYVMYVNDKLSEIKLEDIKLEKSIHNYEDFMKLRNEFNINHIYFEHRYFDIIDIPNSIYTFVNKLNQHMKTKCKELSLSIDHGYRLMNRISKLHVEGYNLSSIILCLSYKDDCISTIYYTITKHTLIISSDTNEQYRKNKYNTLLRAISVMITKKFKLKYLISKAINPISVYTLSKYFNVEYDLPFKDFLGNQPITLKLCQEYLNTEDDQINVYVPITDENVKRATNLYEKLLEPDSLLLCP